MKFKYLVVVDARRDINTLQPQQEMDQDIYGELTNAVKRLKAPLSELMRLHEQFVLDNISGINEIKSVRDFRKGLEKALETEEKKAKKKAKDVTNGES